MAQSETWPSIARPPTPIAQFVREPANLTSAPEAIGEAASCGAEGAKFY